MLETLGVVIAMYLVLSFLVALLVGRMLHGMSADSGDLEARDRLPALQSAGDRMAHIAAPRPRSAI